MDPVEKYSTGAPVAPFPVNPELTAVAIAYRNPRVIADNVLPRVPVNADKFRYQKHTLAEGFTVPQTETGRRGKPNEVSFSATEETESTIDHALDHPIPQGDIDNARENFDPRSHSTQTLTDLILLAREIRAANLVFNADSYPTNNRQTLSGSDQWNDPNSDPISQIMDALDSMVMRANIMTIGRSAFSKLVRHPKIVKAMHGTAGDSGIATRQFIAELFELEDVFVGESWINQNKKGKDANLQRAWGKHCSLLHRNELATADNGIVTFGFTGESQERQAGSWEDRNIGARGGTRVRVYESNREVISAPDLGYFLENVVA